MRNKQTHDYLVNSNKANAIDNITKAKIRGYIKKNIGNKSRTINQQITYIEIVNKLRIIPIIIKIRGFEFVFFVSAFFSMFHTRLVISYWLINNPFLGDYL
jgi:hypothetical protein